MDSRTGRLLALPVTLVSLVSLVSLGQLGCASPAQPLAMAPVLERRRPPERAPTADIRTYGGQETFPIGRSKIANDDFSEAAARAAFDAGVLVPVVDRAGDYNLQIDIVELEQPRFAFPMNVRLVTRWTLRPRGETAPVWSDVIATTYTEPFRSEFFGIKRLRLANEGAARENIREAVRRIASVVELAAP